MCNIDEILDMFDWNNSVEIQNQGLDCAKNIKSINVFLQPLDNRHNKNVWENCAKTLCARSDDELRPYLIPLFEWLQDLNWPGAMLIFDRLQEFDDDKLFQFSKKESIKKAKALNEQVWLNNILSINE